MLKHATMDMTEGRPLRLLSVFAVPLLIGNIFQQAYNLADLDAGGRFLPLALRFLAEKDRKLSL